MLTRRSLTAQLAMRDDQTAQALDFLVLDELEPVAVQDVPPFLGGM